MTTPIPPNAKDLNQSWSLNDQSIRSLDRSKTSDPEIGLWSHDSDVLGGDRYRDPQTDRDPIL